MSVADRSVAIDGWAYTAVTRNGGLDFDITRRRLGGRLDQHPLRIDAPGPCTIEHLDARVKAFMDLLTLASGTASGVISMSVIPVEGPSASRARAQSHIESRARPTRTPTGTLTRPPDHATTGVHLRGPTFEELVAAWIPLQRQAIGGYVGVFLQLGTSTTTRLHRVAGLSECSRRRSHPPSLDTEPRQRELDQEDFTNRLQRALDAMTTDEERAWIRGNSATARPSRPSGSGCAASSNASTRMP